MSSREVGVEGHNGRVIPCGNVALENCSCHLGAELQCAALVELRSDIGVDGDWAVGQRDLQNWPIQGIHSMSYPMVKNCPDLQSGCSCNHVR